jgi:hypothetical protein
LRCNADGSTTDITAQAVTAVNPLALVQDSCVDADNYGPCACDSVPECSECTNEPAEVVMVSAMCPAGSNGYSSWEEFQGICGWPCTTYTCVDGQCLEFPNIFPGYEQTLAECLATCSPGFNSYKKDNLLFDINVEEAHPSPTPTLTLTPSKTTPKDNFLLELMSRGKNKEETDKNFSLLIQEVDDLKELYDNNIKPEFKYDADDPDGAGTALSKMLEKIGIKSTPNCPCKRRARLMNQLGPEWCEENLNIIISWLKEESEKRNIIFLESIAKLIVIRAIKISKNNKKNQKKTAKKSFTFKINNFENKKTIIPATEFKIQSCSYDQSPWSVIITFTGCCMRLVSNTDYSITFVAIGSGTVEVNGSYACGEYLFGDVCVINGETTTSKAVLNCDTVVVSWDPTINTCCEYNLDSGPDSELAAFCPPTAMRLKSKTTGKVYLNKNQIIKRIRNFQKRR